MARPQRRMCQRRPALLGQRSRCAAKGRWYHIQARDAAKPWRVLLRGIGAIQSATGATAEDDALGTLLTPEPGASGLSVRLAL